MPISEERKSLEMAPRCRGTDEAGPTPGPEGSSPVRTHTPGLGPSQHPKQLWPLTPLPETPGLRTGQQPFSGDGPGQPLLQRPPPADSLLGPAHSTGPAEPSPGQTPRPPDGSSGHVAAAPTTSQTLTTPVPDRAPRLWYTARCGGPQGRAQRSHTGTCAGGRSRPGRAPAEKPAQVSGVRQL